jgi:hypothetical protein
MPIILMDGVKSITLHNGVLRVDCIAAGPNAEERPSGTLLIPANQVSNVVTALVNAVKELDKRVREAAAQTQQPPAGHA